MRYKLSQEFEAWAREHNLPTNPFNVLVFLSTKYDLLPKEGEQR